MKKLYKVFTYPRLKIHQEKPSPQGKSRFTYFIFVLALLLMILPFFLVTQYNHPSADDYCFAVKTNSLGFWPTQLDYYNNWTGRYMATALLTIKPVDYSSLTFYRLLPILLFMAFGASVFIFVSSLLPDSSFQDKGLISFTILALYIIKAPSISEAFYWMAASITYQLASIFCLLLFSLILYQQKKRGAGKFYYTILGSLLCIAIVGSNEISMMLLLIILFLWLLIRCFLLRKVDWNLLVLLLVSMVAAGLVVAAPGNMVRMSAKPEKFQLYFSVFNSIKFAFLSAIVRWLPIAVVMVLLFLDVFNRISDNIKSRYKIPRFSLVHIIMLAILVYVIMALSFFPSYWSQGGVPPPRTVNVIFLFFIFGFLAVFVVTLLYMQNHGLYIPRPSAIFRISLGLLVLVFLVFKTNNVKYVYKDLFEGKAQQYHLEMETRYALLNSCATDSCIIPPLESAPASIFAFDLVPDTTYAVFYYNQCLSDYFNKAYIAAP